MKLSVDSVKVVEVGPRDGLQNEKVVIPLQAKVSYIEALGDAGLKVIEAGAFVSPKWVPQMADTADVYAEIPKDPGVEYPVLVPNMKGLERAIEVGVKSIAIFTAASESFNKRNINMTIDESFENFAAVVPRALNEGMRVRGYVSTAFGCPYEGEVPPEKVLEVCARLLDLGCYEVSVGDTIGVGTPMQVQGVIGMLLQVIPATKLAMHFHDTRGTALANTLASLEMGIATYDASSGGLGGCPYAPGASGNMATEDLVYMLDHMAIETGLDLKRLVKASSIVAPYLDHPLPRRYLQACTRAAVPAAPATAAVQSSVPEVPRWENGWYVVPWQVIFRDVDSFGHVNNAVYLTYFEWARAQMWFDLTEAKGAPEDIGFIMPRAEVDYLAQLGLEPIDICVRVSEMRNTSLDTVYEIRRGEGQVAATGKVVVVLFDWHEQRKTPISDELRRKVRERCAS